jgi:hypothetical protein
MKMAKVTTLNKDYKVENGTVIITEQVEKVLNRSELEQERMNYVNRVTQIDRQIADLKTQKTTLASAITELEGMISKLPITVEDDSE